MRPTREGLAWGALTLALSAVALFGANNLHVMVVAPLWAVGFLQAALGALNLAGLRAARELPPELFAGIEARGRLVLHNRRRALAAVCVGVSELGDADVAVVRRVEPGAEARAPLRWAPPVRGNWALRGLRVASTWPFGLAVHERVLPMPAVVLVYPRPALGDPRPRSGGGGEEREQPASLSATGDFAGLRELQPGDPLNRVHWPTTARAGAPMVVVRTAEADAIVDVVVDGRARRWEAELARAAGEVVQAFQQGYAVGLELPAVHGSPARRLAPQRGVLGRRVLLEALATLPARSEA